MTKAPHRPARVAALLACLVGAGVLGAEEGGPAPARDPFVLAMRPLLETHCVACHGGDEPEAGLDLGAFADEAAARAAPETWALVRDRVLRGDMPPPGAVRPDTDELAGLLRWIDERSGARRVEEPPRRVTLRRLNRMEYENTVRDLVGVAYDADAHFPADDVGHGFDRIGDVLSMPPVLLEKYLAAAEDIAARAILPPEGAEPTVRHLEGEALEIDGGGRLRGGVQALHSSATVKARVELPRAGRYRLRSRAHGDQAGPAPARMAFLLGGRRVGVVDVRAERDAPATYEIETMIEGGLQVVAVAFINDYFRPEDPDPSQRDRNLHVHDLEIIGPLDRIEPPMSQQRLMGDGSEPLPDLVQRLASRAYRRPAADDDVGRLLALAEDVVGADAPVEDAMRAILTAVLVSPHFLFRVEQDPRTAPGGARELSDHELASRLSYFLWSTMPDDRLRGLADTGRLHEPEVLEAEARRMLRDARASTLATGFAVQWLKLSSLADRAPDTDLFPGVDAALLRDMRTETEMFFEAILREDRDVGTLLDADFTFVNERLAEHYGLVGVQGPHMRRVALPTRRRGGVLTQASVLTVTSNPARTSPVQRGKWILETLLDAPPPAPPPGLDGLDTPSADERLTLRERLERHRADPNCAVCHDRMDPLGFALETYDGVGRWRTREGEREIDASARLPDGRVLDGIDGLRDVLRDEPAFLRSLARNLLVYALGRGLSRADDPEVGHLVAALAEGRTLSTLAMGIVGSEAFRRRPAAEDG